jgi:type II secretory pathway component PulF
MILMGVGLVVVVILMVFVLPNLTAPFSTFKADLPLPTKILMGVSTFVKSFILYLIAALVALAVSFMVYSGRPRGKRFKAWLALNLPLIGTVTVMRELGHLARTMSLMLGAGLPLQETMDVLPRTSTNPVFREILERVRTGLFLGQGLTYPMSGERVFPPLFLQMVRVGEDSNTLDATMRVVADFYEAATEERVHAVVSLVTPLITIFMACFVAFVALAVITPMYSLSGAI